MCGLTIDIPGEFESTELYRATLGHKINHKFNPNTAYTHVDSARFGIINALVTKEAVAKDEEYFASYGYSLGVNLPWYKEAYKEFARQHPELANQKLLDTLVSGGEEGMGKDKLDAEAKGEEDKNGIKS